MYSTVNFGPLDLNVPKAPQTQCALNSSASLISQLRPTLPLFSNFLMMLPAMLTHTKNMEAFFFSPTTHPLSQQVLLALVH